MIVSFIGFVVLVYVVVIVYSIALNFCGFSLFALAFIHSDTQVEWNKQNNNNKKKYTAQLSNISIFLLALTIILRYELILRLRGWSQFFERFQHLFWLCILLSIWHFRCTWVLSFFCIGFYFFPYFITRMVENCEVFLYILLCFFCVYVCESSHLNVSFYGILLKNSANMISDFWVKCL